MTPFKFKVGDKVRSIFGDSPFRGFVIGRMRYEEGARKFLYTPGDRVYLVDNNRGNPDSVSVYSEEWLEKR